MPISKDRCKQEATSVTIEDRQNALLSMREQHHRTRPVCGDSNPKGLRAAFPVRPDGAVEAEIICGKDKEGYDGYLHGGIIASLLDGAMTNCLFSHGIPAVTGELIVRMVHPLQAGTKMVVCAWLERRLSPLYLMKAELRQGGGVAAKGKGKFMRMAEKAQWGTRRDSQRMRMRTDECAVVEPEKTL